MDSGSTIACLIAHLEAKGASSVSVCAFLDKPSRRKVHFQLLSKGKFYRGFEACIFLLFSPYFFIKFCVYVCACSCLPLLFCELLQIIDMNVKNILEEPQLNR